MWDETVLPAWVCRPDPRIFRRPPLRDNPVYHVLRLENGAEDVAKQVRASPHTKQSEARHFLSTGEPHRITLRRNRESFGPVGPREEPMHVTRRDLAVAGALALGASSLLRNTAALAESGDEAAVKHNV